MCEVEHRGPDVAAWHDRERVHRGIESLVDRYEIRDEDDGSVVAVVGTKLGEAGAYSAAHFEMPIDIDPAKAMREQHEDLVAALMRARSSEEALRSYTRRLDLAIDTAQLGIIEYAGGSFSCNLQASELLGFPNGTIHLGEVEKVLRKSDSAILRKFWAPEFVGEAEDVIEWKRGKIWLHAKAATIGSADNMSRLLVLLDVSDRISRERELAEQVEVEEQLMGIVSHDLKNPLSTLSLALEALEVSAAPGQERPLALGRKALKRAEKMIFDLLDYTRQRLTQRFPIDTETCDLGSLAKQLVDASAMKEGPSRVTLTKSGDTRGEWDASRLEQVLSNLLDNALAYSPESEPVVINVDGSGADHVCITVQNRGEPIPRELLPTLFSAFTRGSSRGGKASMGLGMHIVKLIIEAHGGHVDVLSDLEHGTRISARLPRRTFTDALVQ